MHILFLWLTKVRVKAWIVSKLQNFELVIYQKPQIADTSISQSTMTALLKTVCLTLFEQCTNKLSKVCEQAVKGVQTSCQRCANTLSKVCKQAAKGVRTSCQRCTNKLSKVCEQAVKGVRTCCQRCANTLSKVCEQGCSMLFLVI